ncbi:MAG: hemin uptake protein HemP [Flavobacteriales bacterium]
MNAPFQFFSQSQAHALPVLHSPHLFAMSREIRILHEGEEYRLRLTRNNRLILTK